MKKYILLSILIVLFVSCENFLTEVPLSTRPIKASTLEDAISTANGAYAALREPFDRRLYGDYVFSVLEGPTGQYIPGVDQDGNAQDAYNLTFSSSNSHFAVYWTEFYGGIEAANIAIENIPLVNDPRLSESERSRLLGEVHFLRAYYYFTLVQLFGEIPLNITPTKKIEDGLIGKSTIKEVYENVIVPDLIKAESSNMPNSTTSGRVSKGAAKSLLAKVYLTMAGYPLNQNDKYELAKNKAQEVIKSGAYNLFQSDANGNTWFTKLNASAFDNMEEHIFMANYQVGIVNNTVTRYLAPSPLADKGGLRGLYPTDQFFNSYESTDLRAQNLGFFFNSYNTINFPRSIFKYFDVKYLETAPLGSKNIPLLRYADVLLVFAEAQNAADGVPNLEAYEAINSIRQRAGLTNLSGLTSDQFKEAVWKERAWELTAENQVWYDMKRTQKAFNGTGFVDFIGFTKPNGAKLTENHIYFPIPQSEIDTNPLLGK